MINPSQIPLPDNTHHSQQTNIHAPGKIRTHNLSRRAAEDLRLRPRGHWDRLLSNGLYLPELKQTEPVVSNHSPPDTAKVINAWVSTSIPHFFSKRLFLAQQPPHPSGPGSIHYRGFLITHNDAPHSVGLLWTSDQSVAETST